MSKPKKRQIFQFTPEQEKQFNQVTVPGTNVSSNTTVNTARKTGVQAQNFQAQEAARKDAEIESRSDRKTVKRQTTVGERLRGDNGYSSYMSAGTPMSGRDPALGTIFDWTVGAKGIDALGKTVLWNFAKYAPKTMLGNWGRGYFTNQALKEGIKDFGRNLSNRLYIENAGKYTLFNQFGDDIGTLLTTKPLTSEAKGKGIAMVASKNGGHKVSEDLYNIAVQDSKELGYQGLESGHDLFRPNLTMHVTDKFPKVEWPNVSLQYIDGKYQFAPSSTQPPIRLLTGTTERPQPNFIQELTNHRIDLGALRNQERIRFNEATGNFEEIPIVSAPEPSTSLKFFERPTYLSPQELTGATRGERNFTPRWHVAKYPGYQLKGLMGGSPLERQISKNGTISVNQLNAYFNKASQIEREVANKVLAEQFAGQKTIDYNQFKKAVQDELIGSYNRVPQTQWADYGLDRLGIFDYRKKTIDDMLTKPSIEFEEKYEIVPNLEGVVFYEKTNPLKGPIEREEVQQWIDQTYNQNPFKLNTFTFESSRFPLGNSKHYDASTLGHSRTYTTPEEPKVLHVMESQSDWGQTKLSNNPTPYTGTTKYLNDPVAYRKFIDGHKRLLAEMQANPSDYQAGAIERQIANIKRHETILKQMLEQRGGNSQVKYLHDNYLQRQLQENLRYAAENGQTKMRYPTSETAAKIEGYSKINHNRINELSQQQMKIGEQFENGEITYEEYNKLTNEINELKKEAVGKEYSPEHQTILKKYTDFPKLFQKLYKGQEVRTVTDAKGNTWYEVDVPKGYLSREWQFKQGGKMNTLQFLKNGSGIHIKKKNRGKFTSYCGGKVTDASIRKAKASGNPTLVKRATFAANARKWKHKDGGILTINNEII